MSLLVPGLGQMLTGRVLSGVLWFLSLVSGFCILAWVAVSPAYPGFYAVAGLAALWAAVDLGMLIHAYRGAPRPADAFLNRPWIAALLSDVVPGIGHLYSGQTLAGIVFLALVFGTHVLTRRIEGFASTALCLVAMIDAFRGAQKLPRRRLRTLGTGVLLRVLLTIVLIFGIRAFLLHPFTVPTNGMAPTLLGNTDPSTGQSRTGDHILVDKLTYRLQPPRRGDIVMFRTDNIQDIPAESRGTCYVKRIVGLPGERVSILPPFAYINGQKLTDPPIFETIASGESGYHGYGLAEDLPGGLPEGKSLASESASILLGPDEYFVLGDNSPSSLDSRYWGPVRRDSIIGRVTKIYWPRGRMGLTVTE